MPAILTIQNTVDSNQSVGIVKGSTPEDKIIVQPGNSEQIILTDGESLAITNEPVEGESQGETQTEGEAEKAADEGQGESQ